MCCSFVLGKEEMLSEILITTSSFDLNIPEIRALEEAGYRVVLNPHKRRLSEDEAKGLFSNHNVVGLIAGLEPLTKEVLDSSPNLRVISRCGSGLDNVDLEAAKEKKIIVRNTPGAPAVAVAELTLGLMLDSLRKISFQDRKLRSGGWDRPIGKLLGASVVGLIGYGHVGRSVARYASAFGAKVLIYDPFVTQEKKDEFDFVDLDTIFDLSDLISLHVPLTEETHHLIDAKRLSQMKPGSILVNTARGALVDEKALLESLKNSHLAGAALDVYEDEPYTGPLIQSDKMIFTAHTGSYAQETRTKQEVESARNLLEELKRD